MRQITLKRLSDDIQQRLVSSDHSREQQQVTFLLLEHILGVNKQDMLLNKEVSFETVHDKQLDSALVRLNNGEPIQYVTGSAHFWGRDFYVDESVLIPRPETEELVKWIIAESSQSQRFLDIGCGSGCIAITLALELGALQSYASDISPSALEITQRNASWHNCKLQILESDILEHVPDLKDLDLVVSNPPYIPQSDSATMDNKVLNHEPLNALFVSDEDPLIFYKRIIEICPTLLKPGGRLYFEVHFQQGPAVVALFDPKHWNAIELRKDIHGKDRMVRAQLS